MIRPKCVDLLASGFVVYARIVTIENPYLEATVRIQDDRDHHVASTGPYTIIRHPGNIPGNF